MLLITIVTGGYKPIYNVWGPHIVWICNIHMIHYLQMITIFPHHVHIMYIMSYFYFYFFPMIFPISYLHGYRYFMIFSHIILWMVAKSCTTKRMVKTAKN